VLNGDDIPSMGDLAFSPDGKLLGFTARDSTLRLLEVPSGVTRRVLTGGRGAWNTLSFSPSGRSVAACGDRGCRLWPLAGKGTQRFFPHVRALEFRSDDAFATGGDDGAIKLWEPSGARFRLIGRHSSANGDFSRAAREVWSLASSQDGRFLASVGSDRAVNLWDLEHGTRQLLGQTSQVSTAVRFGHDGGSLATLEGGEDLRVWRPATGEGTPGKTDYKPAISTALRGHVNKIGYFEYSADGSRIVSAGEDGTVRLWSVAPDEPGFLNAGSGLFSDVGFSPDGRAVACAWLERWGAKRARVWLWDSQNRARTELPGTLALPWNSLAEMSTRAFSFSPDGERLAALSQDGSVLLWRLPSGGLVTLRAHAGSTLVVSFAPDSGLLASAGEDRKVRLWTRDGEARGELTFPGGKISNLTFAPSGHTLAVAGWDGSLLLWDPRQSIPRSLARSKFGIRHLAFSPDGTLLASSHQDGAIRIWDLATGAFREWMGHELFVRQALFSPDGTHVVSGGLDGTVRVWDVASGRARVLRGHGQNVGEVSFSPDGQRIASAGVNDTSARIWDVETGESRLLPHEGLHSVHRAQYSPDGRLVHTAAADGVRVWRDDLPIKPAALQRWLAAATDLRVSFGAAPGEDGYPSGRTR
jgi:WD40 repeat protein